MLGINAFRGTPVVAPSGARRYTDEAHAIAARDVEFDWDGVPLHYVPNEPMVTHVINFMHLVLPEGERAMSATLGRSTPRSSRTPACTKRWWDSSDRKQHTRRRTKVHASILRTSAWT